MSVNVTQIKVHKAEQLVPGPSHLEVEIANATLKKYAAAYSIRSQLPSIAGGHSTICNLRMCHAVMTGTRLI
jgi:hypothetical protein